MCTRRTRAVDDMTRKIVEDLSPSATSLPEHALSRSAFYLMANRSDRAKRVVIRRDWSTGGKGVVFKFRPTVNKRVIVVGNLTQGVRTEGGAYAQSLTDTYRVIRVPFPWLPFFDFQRLGSGAGEPVSQVYTSVPFYGMAVALRPMSCTDGTFPEFDVKVSFDIEYRHPVDFNSTTEAAEIAASYGIYADTYGTGVV